MALRDGFLAFRVSVVPYILDASLHLSANVNGSTHVVQEEVFTFCLSKSAIVSYSRTFSCEICGVREHDIDYNSNNTAVVGVVVPYILDVTLPPSVG